MHCGCEAIAQKHSKWMRPAGAACLLDVQHGVGLDRHASLVCDSSDCSGT